MSNKAARIDDLSRYIEACSMCPYSGTRAYAFTGEGNINTEIVLIGDNVRENDNREGKLFAKRAGLKLDDLLTEAGIRPAGIYKTTLIRCYGGREPQFSEWRAFKRCRSHTLALYKIMKPKVIVLCGLKAFLWLVIRYTNEQVDEKTFPKWVGKVVRLKQVWGDTKILVIESPAALARRRQTDLERKIVEGLQSIKAYVLAQKNNEPFPIDMIDLKSRRKSVDQQLKFDFSAKPAEPKPQEATTDGSVAPSSSS